MDFTAGVKGYRVDADSAHYYTELNVYPEVILYSTDAIKTYVTANKYRFAVRNRIFAKLIDTNTNDTIAEYKADDDDHSMLSRLEGADYGTVQTTVSDLTKIMESYHNDTVNRAVTVNWDITFNEKYASSGDAVVQNSGRFYDLLPEGADYVPDSAVIYADGKPLANTDVTITVDGNWRDSERTMLIVSFTKSADVYEMTYQSVSSWDALRDYGRQLLNTAAYETGNNFVGDGYPDDGTASAGTADHPASQRITEDAENRPYPNLVIASFDKNEAVNIPVMVKFASYLTRSDVTVTLKRNNEEAATAEIGKSSLKTIFAHQPKYDADGNAYVYTLDVSLTDSNATAMVTGDINGFTVNIVSESGYNLLTNQVNAEAGENAVLAEYRKDTSYKLFAYDIRSGNVRKAKNVNDDVVNKFSISSYSPSANVLPTDISSWTVDTFLPGNASYTLGSCYFYRFIFTVGDDGTLQKIQANNNSKIPAPAVIY